MYRHTPGGDIKLQTERLRGHLEGLRVAGRIILRWIVETYHVKT